MPPSIPSLQLAVRWHTARLWRGGAARAGHRLRRTLSGTAGASCETVSFIISSIPAEPTTAHGRVIGACPCCSAPRWPGFTADSARTCASRSLSTPSRCSEPVDTCASGSRRSSGRAAKSSRRAPPRHALRRRATHASALSAERGDVAPAVLSGETSRWRARATGSIGAPWQSPRSPPRRTAAEDFRTLSGEPVRELYTPEDLPAGIGGPEDPDRAPRRVPVHARRSTSRCTAGGCGRCASSPASAPARRPTSASTTCSTTARRGCRPRSTCRR